MHFILFYFSQHQTAQAPLKGQYCHDQSRLPTGHGIIVLV